MMFLLEKMPRKWVLSEFENRADVYLNLTKWLGMDLLIRMDGDFSWFGRLGLGIFDVQMGQAPVNCETVRLTWDG